MMREYFIGVVDERAGCVCVAEFVQAMSFCEALAMANRRGIVAAGHHAVRITAVSEQPNEGEIAERFDRMAALVRGEAAA